MTDALAAMIAEIAPGPEGDRKVLLLAIEHLVASTRRHAESNEKVVAQVGDLTRQVQALAVGTVRLEERYKPIEDHEARLRKLEANDGSRQAQGRILDWLVKNWASLVALAVGLGALFERRGS